MSTRAAPEAGPAVAEDPYLELVLRAVSGGLDTAFPTDFVADRGYTLGGRDQPAIASTLRTMVGSVRLANARHLVREVITDGIPGDLVEVGTWKGGVVLMMAACLRALEPSSGRRVVGFDSFPGSEATLPAVAALKLLCRLFPLLPRAVRVRVVRAALAASGFSAQTFEDAFIDDFAAFIRRMRWSARRRLSGANLQEVREVCRRYGLGDRIWLVPGDLSETLPDQAPAAIALLRLDVDFLEATAHSLSSLYDRLSPGGFCIVDDYGAITVCREAVDDFRESQAIDAELVWVDEECVYWRKPDSLASQDRAGPGSFSRIR